MARRLRQRPAESDDVLDGLVHAPFAQMSMCIRLATRWLGAVVVAFVISTVSAPILVLTAGFIYDFERTLLTGRGRRGIRLPDAWSCRLRRSAGAVLPTARAAQAVGMLVWFVMLFLGAAGPPWRSSPTAYRSSRMPPRSGTLRGSCRTLGMALTRDGHGSASPPS